MSIKEVRRLLLNATFAKCKPAELLRVVLLVRDVPLELVDEGDVAEVDVELDHDPLVLLLLQQVVRLGGVALHLERGRMMVNHK